MNESNEFERELERRLKVLDDPEYDDPARADLPSLDLVLIGVLVVLIVVGMYWWGF